jgi:transposase-like protein
METKGQWCDSAFCPDVGKIDAYNIKIHSYAERRFYCTTCRCTFGADKGTFFEALRTPRLILLDAVAMMVERNSLRAISRIKHCKVDAVLHWVDLAGQQGAAVNRHFIRNLHLTQVQIDELWSFVKKNRSTCNRRILPIGVMPGSGVRLPCPITCVSSRICRTNAAKKRQKLFWRPSNRAQTGDHPCSPVTSSRLTLRHSSPPTARLSYLQLNAAVVVLARHRVGCWIRTCFTHRLTNDARKDVSLRFADGSSSVRQKSSLKCSANNRSTLPMSSVTT